MKGSTVPSPSPPPEHRSIESGKSQRSKFWISLSLVLSTIILLWSFTLPFRKTGNPIVSSIDSLSSEGPDDLSERIERRRSTSEEFRQAAVALDREFMQSLAKKRAARPPVPTRKESREVWDRQVATTQRQLHALSRAPEGSVEWMHRRAVMQALADGPDDRRDDADPVSPETP